MQQAFRLTDHSTFVLLALAAATAVYVAMAIAAAAFDRFPGDPAMLNAVQGIGWLEPFAFAFDASQWIIRFVAAGVVLGLMLKQQWPFALAFAATWVAPLPSRLTQELVARPRPEGAFDVHVFPETASFPSGHAVTGAVFATLVALAALRWLPRATVAAVVGACVAFTLIAGVARLWLGAHWFSDALAGWILGISAGVAAWLIAEYAEAKRERRRIAHLAYQA